MKNKYLLLVLITLILVASCTPVDQPAETDLLEANTPVFTEAVITEPTHTSIPDPTSTEPIEEPAPEQSESLPPSPPEPTHIPCSGEFTSPNQEGPFYKTGSPERESLIDEGLAGVPILILGRVFDQDCNPMPGVKIDFWLADVDGEYDNVGYTLRGHQFTDENGYYSIESIEPTAYTGRPPHIHVKLFAADGQELLTTQMYFPGSEGSADVQNSPDLFAIYLDPDGEGRQQVLFNFIVQN
jgi:protocatechuate 3,4-dioxygenase beta subunit